MIEPKYRTGGKRIFAAIVDNVVFSAIVILVDFSLKGADSSVHLVVQFIWPFLPLAYSIYMHYKYGFTIGKKVAQIAVIDVGEKKYITLKQSVLRDLFYLIAILVDIVQALYNMQFVNEEYPQPSELFWYSDIAVLIWFLLEIVTMLTNKKRRALHDLMAKTVVIRTDPYSNPGLYK